MKRAFKIILPIILAIALLATTAWYLFVFDREFTRDMLLSCARYFEDNGNHSTAQWFYDTAYAQVDDNDSIAIELSEHYKETGNYTKAEYTLYKAIQDGGGVELYMALSKLYVEQDKLLDAANLLNNVTGYVKAELEGMRPDMPKASPDPNFYTQLITVTISAQEGTLYVNKNGQYPSVKSDLYTEPFSLVEGENTIYAISVSDEGLVSPLAVYGYTLGGIIEKVQFVDASIEESVRGYLGVTDTTDIYTNDLWELTEFTVPENVSSFEDLKYMTSLESLTIQGGPSGQLSFLSSMPNLKQLSISDLEVNTEEARMIGSFASLTSLSLNGCSLTTTTPFAGLTLLTYLDLSNNTIRDISALTSMTALQELHMNHNALNDLSVLNNCTALQVLDVAFNDLSDISSVFSMQQLTSLDASNNNLGTISGIEKLQNLERLYVSYNQLTSIAPAANCKSLVDLKCGSNQLSDISALSALNGLMYLDFSRNQVTKLPSWSKESELVTIDGSHNQLSSLSALSGLEMLNNVYMDYNENISSVAELATCFLLIRVDVYGTKVTDASVLTDQSIIVNYDPTL